MRDISARELKGHNILAVERFQDSHPLDGEFMVRKPRTPYAAPAMRFGLFLTEDGYRQALTPSAASRSRSSGMPTL